MLLPQVIQKMILAYSIIIIAVIHLKYYYTKTLCVNIEVNDFGDNIISGPFQPISKVMF